MSVTTREWEHQVGRRLKLRDLHILAAVVQCGSMAKAASQLAMSQPAVSEAIASLESALGVRLLDRLPRGIAPTLYAHALLKRGQVVFDELRQGIREIEFLADPTIGEVRLACPETFAAGLLPEAIDRLSRQYPKIVIRVDQPDTRSLGFQELRERSVDLILVRRPKSLIDDDLNMDTLLDDTHRVVVGANNPLARRRRIALKDIVNEPWILPPNIVVGELIAEAFAAKGLAVPAERVNSSSIMLRNRLLATGRYVTILTDSVLRYNAKVWSLRILPIQLQISPRPLAVVTLKHRTLSPAVRLFIDQLKAVATSLRETNLKNHDCNCRVRHAAKK